MTKGQWVWLGVIYGAYYGPAPYSYGRQGIVLDGRSSVNLSPCVDQPEIGYGDIGNNFFGGLAANPDVSRGFQLYNDPDFKIHNGRYVYFSREFSEIASMNTINIINQLSLAIDSPVALNIWTPLLKTLHADPLALSYSDYMLNV